VPIVEDISMRQAPCKDCPESGCGSKHDTCERYQEWDRERKAYLQWKMGEFEIIGGTFDCINAFRKSNRKKEKER
jgi:hypothetical protein